MRRLGRGGSGTIRMTAAEVVVGSEGGEFFVCMGTGKVRGRLGVRLRVGIHLLVLWTALRLITTLSSVSVMAVVVGRSTSTVRLRSLSGDLSSDRERDRRLARRQCRHRHRRPRRTCLALTLTLPHSHHHPPQPARRRHIMRRHHPHRVILREKARVRIQQRAQEAGVRPVEVRIRPLRLLREHFPLPLNLKEPLSDLSLFEFLRRRFLGIVEIAVITFGVGGMSSLVGGHVFGSPGTGVVLRVIVCGFVFVGTVGDDDATALLLRIWLTSRAGWNSRGRGWFSLCRTRRRYWRWRHRASIGLSSRKTRRSLRGTPLWRRRGLHKRRRKSVCRNGRCGLEWL